MLVYSDSPLQDNKHTPTHTEPCPHGGSNFWSSDNTSLKLQFIIEACSGHGQINTEAGGDGCWTHPSPQLTLVQKLYLTFGLFLKLIHVHQHIYQNMWPSMNVIYHKNIPMGQTSQMMFSGTCFAALFKWQNLKFHT